MTKEATITLLGVTGKRYSFDIYPWGARPLDIGGAVYAVLEGSLTDYYVLYIGETAQLRTVFDDHPKHACFDLHGKTHVAVHPEASEAKRLTVEANLLTQYHPICNI